MTAVNVQEKSQQLGRYELLSELGQGAMGVVYKARDPVLDRVVAIKTINLTLPKDELSEYEARFYQEARAAGGLNHPNIVTIYDIGKSERMAYMAMEFLEGEELRSVLSHREPLPVTLALDIAAQVAEGLDYAHERHIVHRDIKPANIMIVRDGLVKITDFGIARMRTNEVKTMTGMILGSPKYMSPEQVAGKRADHRADLFSLGVVFYEMLTGHAPFMADNIHGIMYQILNFTPPAPSTRNPGLPEMVDLIITKALAKGVEERYQSAREFADDLKNCRDLLLGKQSAPAGLHDSGPGAPPPPSFTRTQDNKLAALKPAPGAVAEWEPSKGLALAKSFDSYEATLKLAALTESQPDGKGGDTQKLVRPDFAEAPAAAEVRTQPQDGSAAAAIDSEAEAPRSYAYLWVLSAIALTAAVVMYLVGRS